jgi:hypothetical protein
MDFRTLLAALGPSIVATVIIGCSQKVETTPAEKPMAAAADLLKEHEAKDIGIEAYIYAYPLVTMELTRRGATNVVAPEGSKAQMGQFARLRGYPAIDDHSVTAPNADTLYTQLWVDVTKEPWIISVPDMKGRYYLLPMLDGWTTVFADPGKRTTGTGAQKFAITGPGWTGTLPPGVTQYSSATGIVWLLGRINCTGTPEDLKAVHAIQDQMSAVPLSAYGKPYTSPAGTIDPNIDTKQAIRAQVHAMDGASFFTLFAQLLKTNPPTAEDASMVAKLAKIGIIPGQDFDASKLDSATAKALAEVPKPSQQKIMSWLKEGVLVGDTKLEEGWFLTTKTGLYGTNYRMRALVTAIGLGANRPQMRSIPPLRDPMR